MPHTFARLASVFLASVPDSMKTPTTQRFRHAVGSVDTDSEEDNDLDAPTLASVPLLPALGKSSVTSTIRYAL